MKQTLKAQIAPLAIFGIFILVALFLDQNPNQYTQLIFTYILINIILALSLNLVSGFTGQFSLGHAGFMAVGAYVSGALSLGIIPFIHPFSGGLEIFNFFIYSILGGLAAAVAGMIVGIPSLQLKGDYLAIVTLGFGEIIRIVLQNMNAVGGSRGMLGIPGPQALDFGTQEVSAFFVSYTYASFWVVVAIFTVWRLIRSTHGRAFLSVREDEIAAESMGVNTVSTKIQAFLISSFFAGIAGSILGYTNHFLSPATFSFVKSVDVIIMVVLGGLGSITGSIISACFITIFPELILRPLQEYTKIDLRMVIYALTLILFMVLRPKGIFGTNEISDLLPKNGLKRFKKKSENA